MTDDWGAMTRTGLLMVQTVIAPLIAYAAWQFRRLGQRIQETRSELGIKMDATTAELRTLNGRMIRIEEWRHGHDQSDDRIHHEMERRLGRLEEDK